jgi:hypothetical protein
LKIRKLSEEAFPFINCTYFIFQASTILPFRVHMNKSWNYRVLKPLSKLGFPTPLADTTLQDLITMWTQYMKVGTPLMDGMPEDCLNGAIVNLTNERGPTPMEIEEVQAFCQVHVCCEIVNIQGINAAGLHTDVILVEPNEIIAINGEKGALWLAIVKKNNVIQKEFQVQWMERVTNDSGKAKLDLYTVVNKKSSKFDCIGYGTFICAGLYLRVTPVT